MARHHATAVLVAGVLAPMACAPPAVEEPEPPPRGKAGAPGATAPAADVDMARAMLAAQALDPAAGPPADPTNRFADDPRAAALGQRFFFDAGFSGQLIDD